MSKQNFAPILDVALLEAETTYAQLKQLCADAKKYGYASVAIMPGRVKQAAKLLEGSGIKIDVAIGFPLGMTTPAVKAFETTEAIANGAGEVDMVIAVGKLKDGDYDAVLEDMKAVVGAAKANDPSFVVKAILETGYLAADEVVKGVELAVEAGMDFVKTSTGFTSDDGAHEYLLRMMNEAGGGKVAIKASGKVRNYEKAVAFTKAGATRLGCSIASARRIIEAFEKQ